MSAGACAAGRGALIAGWLFVIPGALIVLALSWLYVSYGTLPLVAAAFDGVKCAVVALVAEALYKIGKRALKTHAALLIAVAAFVALMLGAPFPLVIVVAGVIGAAVPLLPCGEGAGDEGRAVEQAPDRLRAPHPPTPSPQGGGGVRLALLWLVLWLAPLALIAATLGTDHVLFQVALLFSILACVTFGGAYALLAYLTTEAAARGWLTPEQMIDGLGLAETTPGPLILVNEFVGFLAGWSSGGLALALAGAAIALWCTFAPSSCGFSPARPSPSGCRAIRARPARWRRSPRRCSASSPSSRSTSPRTRCLRARSRSGRSSCRTWPRRSGGCWAWRSRRAWRSSASRRICSLSWRYARWRAWRRGTAGL